ncbi:lipopolysaccharide biosynthesis protein [Fredinandcohnia onubensis]|uniref:lipopolysaccharide biosynthesis protein n=1 Tax=Fredinandcohnia onubensis TaxID=1571209 RepID=UPI000C0BCCAE|nr:lipopolysaccharide biosynthesis protein [Fredinandcohnia onubensis]
MIQQELKKGILINFIAKYSTIIIQLIITSILARLLTPEEFGIVALILVFITFFNMLGDMGIGPAIIQNKSLDENDIRNIFNFTLMIGVVLGAVFALSGRFIADFYDNLAYINISLMLSLVVLFSILNIVPENLLYKDKRFLTVGIIGVVANVFSGAIAIILAYLGYGYYALIFQSILSIFMRFIIGTRIVKLKMKWQWGFYSVKKILNFSTYQFLFNFVNYFSRNFDNLLIGKVMGPTALGYYDKAYRLMLYPLQGITFVITPVLHPVLSQYQDDVSYIHQAYQKLINILSLIGGFFSVYCFFAAEEIIRILFGEQWLPSVPTFKILALSLIFQMVTSSSGSIFQSTNKVKFLFISGVISSIVNITSMIIGSLFGKIEYVALGILIAFGLNFFQVFFLLGRFVFKSSTFSLLKEMKNTIIVVVIMAGFFFLIKFEFSNVIISAVFKLIVASVGFIVGLLVTGQFSTIKSLFLRRGRSN